MAKLLWMKTQDVQNLHQKIKENLNRYKSGDFDEINKLESKVLFEYDDSEIKSLSAHSSNDLQDSMIIYKALNKLEPRHATMTNIWVPLIHTKLLDYFRARWGKENDGDKLIKVINDHIFKGGVGGYRDDNAIGRLWWNGHIGNKFSPTPNINDIEDVLKPFNRTTDTRLNSIERPGIMKDKKLAYYISQFIKQGKLTSYKDEAKDFRNFMKNINFYSCGIIFEDKSEKEIFEFLSKCANTCI